MTYAPWGGLTSRDGSDSTWVYDAALRVKQSTTGGPGGVSVDQQFDDADELSSSTPKSGPNAGLTTLYDYDERGNRRSASTGGGPVTAYGFDGASALRSVSVNSVVTNYPVDGDGMRAGKQAFGAGSPSWWAWDQVSTSVPMLLSDGSARYVYGPGGRPVAQVAAGGGAVTYLHQDRAGSTIAATDTAGTVVGRWAYDPYGATTAHTGTATTNLLWQGQYRDSETGMYYLRAREYDPGANQFLSVDPLYTATRSRYNYAANDPVKRIRPVRAKRGGHPRVGRHQPRPDVYGRRRNRHR